MNSNKTFLPTNPFCKINEWLKIEKELGSPNSDRVVLATATKNYIPHSRVVAIREINEDGILFFTQRGTRKVSELISNPVASMTFWLAMQQREIILDGMIQELESKENQHYWETMAHDRQIRFSAYAPTSVQPINSINVIENKLEALLKQFKGQTVPMSEFYCGFRLVPEAIIFYTLGSDSFSEVLRYSCNKGKWNEETLSP